MPIFLAFRPSKFAFIVALNLCFIASAWSNTSNVERERRLEQQAIDTLFIGTDEKLSYSGGEFLTLSSDNEAKNNTAVILMHGRGYDANTPTVIKPLREALEDKGWYHLSLQMPVLEKDAKYYDYLATFPDARARIQAAIDALREQQVAKIVLVAHSCSVHMTLDWAKETTTPNIDAFVGIGMGATDFGQPMEQPLPLEKLNAPVLDIFGSDDYPAVHRLAPERLSAIQANALSKQIVVPAANHEFSGQEEALNNLIVEWIESTFD
jgi:pimeloyl-ACP methyl ester carboxylesterase